MAARKKGLASMMPLLVIGGVVAAYFVWKNSTPNTPPAPAPSSGTGSSGGSGTDDTGDLIGDGEDLLDSL